MDVKISALLVSTCTSHFCEGKQTTQTLAGTNPPTYTPASKLSGMLSPVRLSASEKKDPYFTNTLSPSLATNGVGSDVATRAKLTAMSERIRALEDALQIEFSTHKVQGSHSELIDDAVSGDGNAAARILERSIGTVHPLLVPELLAVKNDIESFVPVDKQGVGDEDAAEDMMTAFGTLSIKDGKNMRFLGATATDVRRHLLVHYLFTDLTMQQTLLMEVFGKENDEENGATLTQMGNGADDTRTLPPDIEQASALWPFAPAHLTSSQLMMNVVSHLPPIERASALIEAYFTNLAWFLGPIERSQVTTELIPLFYPFGRRNDRSKTGLLIDNATNDKSSILATALDHPHDLALLFAVFACGAVSDLTQAPDNAEGSRYHTLSRVTLGLQNIFEGASLSACQAIFLIGSYEVYCGKRTGQEKSWKMFSLAMCLGNSVSFLSHTACPEGKQYLIVIRRSASVSISQVPLAFTDISISDRDPSRWHLDEKIVQRRRRVFWELYSCDQWKASRIYSSLFFRLITDSSLLEPCNRQAAYIQPKRS